MSKKKSTKSRKKTQKVQIIESVGSGTRLTPEQIDRMNTHGAEQPFLTYLIRYGTIIGLTLFTLGSVIQLYFIN